MTNTPLSVDFDPVSIVEDLFGHATWSKSQEILRAIFRPNARVIVKGCNASSKSHTAADAIVLTLLLGGDVLNTAPTGDQISGVLWRQVRQAIEDARIDKTGWLINQTSVKLPTGETALGRSTDQGVRFQGYHARPGAPLLVVVDEAPGVIGEIMDAIGGISAGGDVRLLFLGNPIIPSGEFYKLFAVPQPGWNRITISALENPNFEGVTIARLLAMTDEELAQNPRPYLADRRWVKEIYLKEGPNSGYYFSHVLGEFPPESSESLIPLAQIEAAALVPALYVPLEDGGEPLVAGVDVAGPGEDETVVVVRQGRVVLEVAGSTMPDSRAWVMAILKRWLDRGLVQVNVDSIGIGWNFMLHLRDQFSALADQARVQVVGVNVNERPLTHESQQRFANLKAEAYWNLRDRFRDGQIGGITDPILKTQCGSLRYQDGNRRGKTVIESKDELRRRGIDSPDRAEALMLAFCSGPDEGSNGIGHRERLSNLFGRGGSIVGGGTRRYARNAVRSARGFR